MRSEQLEKEAQKLIDSKIRNLLRIFLQSIADYEHESGDSIHKHLTEFDRQETEFVNTFLDSEDAFDFRQLLQQLQEETTKPEVKEQLKIFGHKFNIGGHEYSVRGIKLSNYNKVLVSAGKDIWINETPYTWIDAIERKVWSKDQAELIVSLIS